MNPIFAKVTLSLAVLAAVVAPAAHAAADDDDYRGADRGRYTTRDSRSDYYGDRAGDRRYDDRYDSDRYDRDRYDRDRHDRDDYRGRGYGSDSRFRQALESRMSNIRRRAFDYQRDGRVSRYQFSSVMDRLRRTESLLRTRQLLTEGRFRSEMANLSDVERDVDSWGRGRGRGGRGYYDR